MALEVAWAYGSAIWPGIKGLGLILPPSFCPLSVFLATFCAVCLDGSVLEGRAEPFPRVAVAVPGVQGCDAAGDEAPPPSSPLRAESHGQSNIGSFLLAWQVQLIYGQALEWPKREAGHQQLGRGRTCIPQAPLSSWGTSMRNLTSLF